MQEIKKRIALITVICGLGVFFLVLMPVLSVIVYNDNFGEMREEYGEIFKDNVNVVELAKKIKNFKKSVIVL